MTLVSRILGLVRDQAIAISFGANATTDAFWVAFRIPNFMRRLFAEGAFATAFVPVFTETKETRSPAELRELLARTAGTLGGVLLLVTALGMLFAPALATLFAGSADPFKYSLLVDLLRLTFPFLLFISLTALVSGALNSFGQFALPALTPVILNLCMISGALWLAPRLQVPILALGWAVLIAGIVQLLFQLPALHGIGLLTLPRWGWSHPGVRKILKLMVPTLFGASVTQINLLLGTVIAAQLYAGSQSWLMLADRFLELPLGVFGVALGTVILPTLSKYHVSTDHTQFSSALDWGLRTTWLIAAPAMIGLLLLARPLITTLFQYQQFTAFDTQMTAWSVYGLCLGLPAFALLKVILPAFYARQDTKTPVRAGIITVFVNISLNGLLLAVLYHVVVADSVKTQGVLAALHQHAGLHVALSFATALSSWLNLFLLYRWLRRAQVYQRQPGWGRHLRRLFLACLVMAVIVCGLQHYLPAISELSLIGRVSNLALLLGSGIGSYVLALRATGWHWRELKGH